MATLDEQLNTIQTALKLQNQRVKKKLKEKYEFEQNRTVSVEEVLDNFNSIRKYTKNVLMQKLNNMPENKRYKFIFIDNIDDYTSRDISKYFKIIINNIVSQQEYFIILTFSIREFVVKFKPIVVSGDSEPELNSIKITARFFNKVKFRRILFDYILDIIKKDTLSGKKLFVTVEDEEINL